ncbi:MAG: futalosine hydrolase [Marinilabiliales bacterium]|nr:futalosine hydrolase [Marinilabiliales bacterium]
MRILFVGATCFELYQFFENLVEIEGEGKNIFRYKWYDLEIDLLIPGVGMTFTAYHLTRALYASKYDLVINAGIAGSFRDELSIGMVVNVKTEQICDLGIEEDDRVVSLFDAGFMEMNQFPFENGKMTNPHHFKELELTAVEGVTGNISHGCNASIHRIYNEFNADVESMEGASVFYVCLHEKVPFLEIRAISNFVESRDTTKWDIPLAIENLTDELFRFLRKFAKIKQLS